VARLEGLIHAAHLALGRGRSVLIIAPELARASALFAQARMQWGNRVALWHGGLAPGLRADLWRRIRSGAVDLLVGTRSAVFAPLASPGLLCVDEEDGPSLKEEQEPHYHAREVARMRAQQHQAVLLLGSSHPSLETMGRTDMAPLGTGDAADRTACPAIQTVDIRHEAYGVRLSRPMVAGLQTALSTRAGALLFLNRKGFAPAIQCRECGQALLCHECSVPLTFYRRAGRLTCYYCRASFPVPDVCPSCQAAKLEPSGFGTEQLEDDVRRHFPEARVLRLDRDTARTGTQAQAIRREIAEGTVDLVIGTQMLFQGPPLPPVGFVGIPHADAGLHRPDYRAAERTYHGLLDAVGLARPAHFGGMVLLQTYLPTHHAIAAVVNQDPSLFYEHELASRQALGYPPFTHLIGLRVSGKHTGQVAKAAQDWAARLLAARPHSREGRGSVAILGPIPAGVAQARGRHRWQLLVKSADAETARQAVRSSLASRPGLKFEVDVDPLEIG
jgi:primosomal protein N' (replication factor Y)